MRGVEANGFEAVVIFIGIVLFFASLGVRLYIFRNLKDDNSIRELLENASIIGSDLLVFRLIRIRSRLSSRARAPVFLFIFTQVFGLLLLIIGVTHAVYF